MIDGMVATSCCIKGIPDGRDQLIMPLECLECDRASLWGVIYGMVSNSQADQMVVSTNSSL